jgi:outer membrane protein OmpA-like peptidoglycan-associated protein
MPNWTISIVERPEAGDYAITQRTAVQSHTFYCKLPPDLLVELREGAGEDHWRGLTWRRPPEQVQTAQIYFNAADRATLAKIGGRLFDALFTIPPSPQHPEGNSLGDVLMNEVAHAKHDRGYLTITLDLSKAPQLVAVPWEAMYFDAEGGRFLATDVATNLIRVLPRTYTMPLPPPIEGPLRLLSVISNPFGDLDVEKERAKIETTLGPIQVTSPSGAPRAAFTLLPAVTAATRAKLRAAIRDHKPHILHYSGHGVSGAIALEKDGKPGEADLIDTAALRQIVQNDPPWLAFLNSCEGAQATPDLFGGTAQGLLAVDVPFVVAMQFPISDKAAILFADEFYRALAGGEPVVQAVSRGRSAVATEEDLASELSTPVLYSSGRADTIAQTHGEPPPAPPGEATPPPPALRGAMPRKWIVLGGLAAVLVLATAGAVFVANSFFSGMAEQSIEDIDTANGPEAAGAGPPGDGAEAEPPWPAPSGPTASMSRPPREAFPQEIAVGGGAHTIRHVVRRRARSSAGSSAGAGVLVPEPPLLPPPPLVPQQPVIVAPDTPDGSINPPPPAPTPPPPLPDVEVGCRGGAYLVFFDWNDATLGSEAATTLDAIVGWHAGCPDRRVRVTGHADSSGTQRNNHLVSQRRATAVESYLSSRGVPVATIETTALGETDPRVPTTDDIREVQNRRVEIVFESVIAPELETAINASNPDPLVKP